MNILYYFLIWYFVGLIICHVTAFIVDKKLDVEDLLISLLFSLFGPILIFFSIKLLKDEGYFDKILSFEIYNRNKNE